MTRAIFDRLVNSIVESGDGVLFETSYGAFFLSERDGQYRLELAYKYASGLDRDLQPIYQYTDDYVWDMEYSSRDELFGSVCELLARDPYGTDYSKRKAKANIKGE